jgi:hypothetical protein
MISIKPIKNIIEFYQNHMQMQILIQFFHPISRCLYSLLKLSLEPTLKNNNDNKS